MSNPQKIVELTRSVIKLATVNISDINDIATNAVAGLCDLCSEIAVETAQHGEFGKRRQSAELSAAYAASSARLQQ